MSIRRYGQDCSIARSLEIVGERWTFLIIRNALLGDCRFDTFLNNLGLARNVLTERLNTLVENGVFERVPYQNRPLRHEYRLTTKGRELASVLIALMQWGEQHLPRGGAIQTAEHEGCGGIAEVKMVCQRCGKAVDTTEVGIRHVTAQPITRAVRRAGRTAQGGRTQRRMIDPKAGGSSNRL